jgi:hypothetical protein
MPIISGKPKDHGPTELAMLFEQSILTITF